METHISMTGLQGEVRTVTVSFNLQKMSPLPRDKVEITGFVVRKIQQENAHSQSPFWGGLAQLISTSEA